MLKKSAFNFIKYNILDNKTFIYARRIRLYIRLISTTIEFGSKTLNKEYFVREGVTEKLRRANLSSKTAKDKTCFLCLTDFIRDSLWFCSLLIRQFKTEVSFKFLMHERF